MENYRRGTPIVQNTTLSIFNSPFSIRAKRVPPGSPNVTVWVSENLVVNEPSKIIGVVPDLLPDKPWNIVIRIQFAGSGTLLKETREIMSGFTVEKAP
jgi:hypothetical protein